VVAFEPMEHRISADVNRVKEARDFAARAAAEFGFDDDACYCVKLAMSEAVTNAIQHGSSSPTDTVVITVTEESGALIFEVFDTGRFRPRLFRGDMPEHGRGFEFMRALMDDVDLRPSAEGTLVRLTKRAA
jgi:anti-sigma regulatory factor (Ser/Thr protein kinase)